MWWLYRGFDLTLLVSFFGLRTNYVWITLTLLAGITANVLRSYRWRMLLRSADIQISTRRSIELVFISYLINSVTPRLGELTRCLLVKRGNAEISTRALGTVVVEKMADICCLLLVLGLALGLRWQQSVSLVESLGERFSFALPSYAIYIIIGAAICLLIGLSLPLKKYLRGFFLNLWKGVTAIARLRRPIGFVLLCVGIWICNFLQLYLLLPCFEDMAGLGVADMIHLFAAVSLGVLLPTPGGAGPWHFAIVKTLTAVHHVQRPAAQSFALITHGLKTALIMLLGLLGYASYYTSVYRRWKRLQATKQHSRL